MLSGIAIRKLLAGATAATTAGASLHNTYEFEQPVLLVALPGRIMSEFVAPTSTPEFSDPYRTQLHSDCRSAAFFDRLSVTSVNKELHDRNIPLTAESYKALTADMAHTRQMKYSDPLAKKIQDYRQQSANQKIIADSFRNSNEPEGAFMHDFLSHGFNLKAAVAQGVNEGIDFSYRDPLKAAF